MQGLNLLPWRERQRRVAIRRLQAQLLGVGLAAVLMVWFIDAMGRKAEHRQQLDKASVQQALDVLDGQLAQLARQQIEHSQVERQLGGLTVLQGKRWALVDLFERVQRAVPQHVYLTALTHHDERLNLHGVARSGALVAQLMRNLADEVGVTDMQQLKAVDEGEAFELSVALRGLP